MNDEDINSIYFRLCVAYKDSVPFFEPVLLPAMEFKKDHKFKEFLLKKCKYIMYKYIFMN